MLGGTSTGGGSVDGSVSRTGLMGGADVSISKFADGVGDSVGSDGSCGCSSINGPEDGPANSSTARLKDVSLIPEEDEGSSSKSDSVVSKESVAVSADSKLRADSGVGSVFSIISTAGDSCSWPVSAPTSIGFPPAGGAQS